MRKMDQSGQSRQRISRKHFEPEAPSLRTMCSSAHELYNSHRAELLAHKNHAREAV